MYLVLINTSCFPSCKQQSLTDNDIAFQNERDGQI